MRLLLMFVIIVGAPGCDQRSEGTQPGDCTDGADNDGDGSFDCSDPGCVGAPACSEGADGGGLDAGGMDASLVDDAGDTDAGDHDSSAEDAGTMDASDDSAVSSDCPDGGDYCACLPTGATCVVHRECQHGFYCPSGTCVACSGSQCQECSDDTVCGCGLSCISGRCEVPVPVDAGSDAGDSCRDAGEYCACVPAGSACVVHRECQSGHYCLGGVCTSCSGSQCQECPDDSVCGCGLSCVSGRCV